MQQISAQGAAFTMTCEGFVPHWYADPTGTGTLGPGLTWSSSAFRQWWAQHRPGQTFGPGVTMTREEGQAALLLVMNTEYGAAVSRFIGHDVPQHVFDGSSDCVYNCGAGALQDSWAAYVRAGSYPRAGQAILSDRVTSRGRRLAGLVNRRREESQLIVSGDYTVGTFSPDPLADGLLVRGERGPAVTTLQSHLQAAGLYNGKIDGVFGYGTEAAVLAFQRSHPAAGAADGVAGPKTLALLQ